jgi:predicted Zn-dependent peptidase
MNPSFADIERLRVEQLTGIQIELTDPGSLAMRTLPGLIYGPGHPYGVPGSGLGDPAAVAKLTKADLVAFKDKWVRPDTATIFVVSDLPLATLQPLLESRFGAWKAPGAAGVKRIDQPIPAPKPRILLFDRPGSAQSTILGGEVLTARGTDELLPFIAANEALGGTITSRLNVDIRETKNWSYGVDTGLSRYYGRIPYILSAPVQTDKTGPAMAAMLADINAFLTTSPMTQAERDTTVQRSIRSLPGSFETGDALLGGMQRNDMLKRPDDYYNHLADQYRALTVNDINAAAQAQIRPKDLTWVIVGDAAQVKPQLDALGLPVEMAKAPAVQ